MKNLLDFFRSFKFIFIPSYWLMNNPYSKKWDDRLNELLDNHEFTNVGRYTANLGPQSIWIANYPYDCFSPYALYTKAEFRPSRLTIYRANKKLCPVKTQQTDLYDEYLTAVS